MKSAAPLPVTVPPPETPTVAPPVINRPPVISESLLRQAETTRKKQLVTWTVAAVAVTVLSVVWIANARRGGQRPVATTPQSGCAQSRLQVTAEADIKASLRDPDSFELVGWRQYVQDDLEYDQIPKGLTLCGVTYRAKNGFGGYAVDERFYCFGPNGAVPCPLSKAELSLRGMRQAERREKEEEERRKSALR